MNYLAHFYLSGPHEHLIAGNFIADAVKGKQVDAYPDALRRGILMHRSIDFFTDTHAISSRSKDRLRADFNHYSAVIVDIFYDHFLARHWNDFSEEPLTDYARRVYSILEKQAEAFPEKPKYILQFMQKHDWLSGYASMEGMRRVFGGMARRARFESKMELAPEALLKDYAHFEKDFLDFFPELIAHTADYRLQQ